MPTETAPRINYGALVEAVRKYNDSQGYEHPVLSHAFSKHTPLADAVQENARRVGVDLNPPPIPEVIDTIGNGLKVDPDMGDGFGHLPGIPN